MPELSNIQTYEKLTGDNYQPTLDRFIKVLKGIDLWNEEVKKAFDSFEWKVEDNGFIYSSITEVGHLRTKYSDIPVRPLVMVYTPAIDKTFKDNWIICELLIEAERLRSFTTGQFYKQTYPLVKTLAIEMAKEFSQTGIYFTDEAQDGQDFDGLRTLDTEKLWNFDYAIIPFNLENLYSFPTTSHKAERKDNFIEAWDVIRWTPN